MPRERRNLRRSHGKCRESGATCADAAVNAERAAGGSAIKSDFTDLLAGTPAIKSDFTDLLAGTPAIKSDFTDLLAGASASIVVHFS